MEVRVRVTTGITKRDDATVPVESVQGLVELWRGQYPKGEIILAFNDRSVGKGVIVLRAGQTLDDGWEKVLL